ncbi:DNA damage-inducible protein DinB [Dokdonia pacifica]|uniref:DinB superfamily protein n=1 Tax=Dokdonia pacifica TaxID=1627892 RepID=A0A238YLS0_9FLAO|nr:DinB family protein [Dokdonia pacifica]GGG11692.1 DNA damage-inducible protein DinB [Dokdonia pacifica]SNR71563.1 DinB superfamily protein [Dokdonia pacifica]
MYTTDLNPSEYNPYYEPFIKIISTEVSLVEILKKSKDEVIAFFKEIPTEKLSYRYDIDKWTPREVLMHIIDTERIFAYRALRFARKDKLDLLGFDQNDFIPPSNADTRSIVSLIEEYEAVRNATVVLFKNFDETMLKEIGMGSGSPMSVRALGFITVGHEKHHVSLIKERYL